MYILIMHFADCANVGIHIYSRLIVLDEVNVFCAVK